MAMEGGKDYYATLGLPRSCSRLEIRSAYRKLAVQWHPDKCVGVDPELAKRKFQAIQEAYSVLSDELTRFVYDAGLYEEEQDEEEDDYGMDEFISELTGMMTQMQQQEQENSTIDDLKSMLKDLTNPSQFQPFSDFGIPHQQQQQQWKQSCDQETDKRRRCKS